MFEYCYSLIFHSVQTIVNRQHAFLNEHGEVSSVDLLIPRSSNKANAERPRDEPAEETKQNAANEEEQKEGKSQWRFFEPSMRTRSYVDCRFRRGS